MTCQAVQRMLLEEEGRRRRRTVARHLASCPACRRYAEDLAQIARPGALPLIDPGEPLLQQTLDRIRQLRPRVAEAARRSRRLPEPALRTAWAAAAALAVAAAAATWWIRRTPTPERIGAAAMPLEEEISVLEAELLLEATWIDAWDRTAVVRRTDAQDENGLPLAWPEVDEEELDRLSEVFDEIAG